MSFYTCSICGKIHNELVVCNCLQTVVFGSSHDSKANEIEIRQSGTNVIHLDPNNGVLTINLKELLKLVKDVKIVL